MITAKIKIEGEESDFSIDWSDSQIMWSTMIVNRRKHVHQVLDDFVSEKEDVEIVIVARRLN